jgi:hypothetical protein
MSILVDLDGTLAHYDGWKGASEIGEPIPATMERLKDRLAKGKTVKIFTARAGIPEQIPPIKEWLAKHGLPDLEVTNVKDFTADEIWDDRAITIEINTGKILTVQPGQGKIIGSLARDERAEAIESVLRKLADKLTAIDKDPSRDGIYAIAFIHGFKYTGPNYKEELGEARKLLGMEDK